MRFGPSPTRCALPRLAAARRLAAVGVGAGCAPRPRYFTVYTSPVNYWEASPERKKEPASSPLEGPSRGRLRRPPFERRPSRLRKRSLESLVDLKAALLRAGGDARARP